MSKPDFTKTIVVDQSPEEVFNAVTNVRGWWSEEVEGNTTKLNDEFNYHFEDLHACKIKVIEVVPAKKIVWHVLENYFKFVNDKTEWVDSKIVFEISKQGSKTQLQFTHQGLNPEHECYDACYDGWTHYIGTSLYNLITTGKGKPNATGRPTTATEKKQRAETN